MAAPQVSASKIHSDYTVGWVCALPKEQTAAMAMLDQIHDDLPKPPKSKDDNCYTLGSIGKHDIVIACLPKGKSGTVSAASVAVQMIGTFPNIKFGLMVGIGGGIPNKTGMRLGDVVVGTPVGQFPGVVQWDLGKASEDGNFERTGALNNPPKLLLTALAKLESNQEINGSIIPEYLDQLKSKFPRLASKFLRSKALDDILFKSGYNHVYKLPTDTEGKEDEDEDEEEEESEEEDEEEGNCKYCDRAKIVKRKNRLDMRVHYGLIASGNQDIQDAVFRDKLNKDLGGSVLCVEMEAAGLLDNFPCIVIRGICDYLDSHKNKLWQEHAAAVAAAFAKELLGYVQANEVKEESPAKDVISNIEKNVIEMRTDVRETGNTVKLLRSDQKQEKVDKWMLSPDPSRNYEEALGKRHGHSGSWFLESNSFAEWKTSQQSSFLWLTGIPGCGKTVLSSTIIQNLESDPSCQHVLYFYFNFTEAAKQKFENMVRSLITQLCHKDAVAAQQIDALFSACKDGFKQPTCQQLCEVFLDIINRVGKIWIVVDALDESSEEERKKSIFWMRETLNSQQANIRILATSRPEEDIKFEITKFIQRNDIVSLQVSNIGSDIQSYIQTRVRSGTGFERWQSRWEVQDEIEIKLVEKANGMFRWAACQLDVLEKCPDYRTLTRALVGLPKTLGDTYARILNSIPEEYKQSAIRILQLLVYSERPLSLEEAVDAIATDIEGEQYFHPKYRMPNPDEILCYCSSLVAMISTRKQWGGASKNYIELHLAHYSVKEYLTSNQLTIDIAEDFREIDAKASLAKVCLAYLLNLDVDMRTDILVETFPFARYCARYWIQFAVAAEEKDERLQGFLRTFFSDESGVYRNCYNFQSLGGHVRDSVWTRNEEVSALYYASCVGLAKTVEYLIGQGTDINAQGGFKGNALQAASYEGHDKVVEILLAHGADTNAQGGCKGNALRAASYKAHDKVVKMLLAHGADVNAQEEGYDNALYVASEGGHDKVVHLLLAKGADINAQGEFYSNALQVASYAGHDKVVEILLAHGADVNPQDGKSGNALYEASISGHDKVVHLLLAKGADINAQGGFDSNALQAASYGGHYKVVEILLAHGADVNIQGGNYGNALNAASLAGHKKIVDLLLAKGTNINAQGGFYSNAVQAASVNGYSKIVDTLLAKGADVNAQGGYYGNALQGASAGGHDNVVNMLLAKGAAVNAQGGHYGNALYAASEGGRDKVVGTLLTHGADVNALSGRYGNAVYAALAGGHDKVVMLLIQHANDNAEDGRSDTTLLQTALVDGYDRVADMLLAKEADINAQCENYGNALHAASAGGYDGLVEMLLAKGTAINAQGGYYGNALQAASYEGYDKIVEILLAHGADVNAQGGKYGNALNAASKGGQAFVADILLAKGAHKIS
ncbi:Ankyrin-3 [Dactylellina cionopaga]|nr:Ankyrin-3 [Dactylellina cionopaga]